MLLAVAVLGYYAIGQYAFYGASVKVGECPYEFAYTKFPEQEQALLCLLDRCTYMGNPGQVVGYRHSQEPDAFNPCSVDVHGGVFSSFLSEVNDQFFSFADIEREAVNIAPCHQALYLVSVFCLIVLRYPSYHGDVIRKFADDVCLEFGYIVVGV
eukprot:g41159.t1